MVKKIYIYDLRKILTLRFELFVKNC